MRAFLPIMSQHMRLAWRSGHSGLAVAFMFIAVMLMPFGLGPELKLLRALAPGLLWVVLVMALMTSLERLFQADFEDGHLDQLMLAPHALEISVMAKLAGHYLALVVPLLLAVPLAGFLLNIAPARVPGLLLAMALGSPALILLGGMGAALAVSVKRGGLLAILLSLPFYVPVLIFGTAASVAALDGTLAITRLAVLALLSAAALCVAPLVIATALRAAQK
jgi:heme exporter protein B